MTQWLRGLLLQRTQVQFSAPPTPGGSQTPLTPSPGYLIPLDSTDICTRMHTLPLHTYIYVCPHTYLHIYNKRHHDFSTQLVGYLNLSIHSSLAAREAGQQAEILKVKSATQGRLNCRSQNKQNKIKIATHPSTLLEMIEILYSCEFFANQMAQQNQICTVFVRGNASVETKNPKSLEIRQIAKPG